MDKRVEFASVLGVFLLALYFWTLPISSLPFGDVDSSTHFALGDYASQKDIPIYWLPPYLNQQYGFESDGKLWYMPHFHLAEGVVSSFNPDRFISVYLFVALLAVSVVLTSYILIRSLYGFYVAILSSFLLVFSMRDYMFYLLGLWPHAASFAMIPLVLYCYWKATSLYIEDKNDEQAGFYLLLVFVLLATQFAFHAYGCFHSIAAMGVFSVWLLIKHKGIPFSLKSLVVCIMAFLILMLPFYSFVAKKAGAEVGGATDVSGISRLFSWYLDYQKWGAGAYPEAFFSYAAAHAWWTLPLLLIGIMALLLRRRSEDMFILAWLVSYYVMIHMDLLGYGSRVPRSYSAEAQLFYPIMAIGLFSIVSFVKLRAEAKNFLKVGAVSAFIILAIMYNAIPAYNNLKHSYEGVQRINPYQVEAALWLEKNSDPSSVVFLSGQIQGNIRKWFKVISMRPTAAEKNPIPESSLPLNISFVVVDYSQFAMLGRNDAVSALRAWESGRFNASRPVFVGDDDLVRVYRI
jgi:hypothetical protein